MKVVFSDRAYASVMAETTEKIQTETGGLFLGTVVNDTWYIIEAIDPGPKSIFEVAYFEYDKNYTQHLINKIANLYDEKLSLIGLWHRHPGSFDIFSTTDNGTNSKYAAMRECGAISGLVNIDPKFRFTMYHVARPCKYTKISYVVGSHLIPEKFLKLKTPKRYEEIMDNLLNPKSENEDLSPSISLESFMKRISPSLNDRKISRKIDKPKLDSEELKNILIDAVVSDISFMSEDIGIQMSVIQKNGVLSIYQESVDGMTKLFFIYDETNNKVVFQYNGSNYIYEEGLFENLYNMPDNVETEDTIKPEIVMETGGRGLFEGVIHILGFDKKGDDE